MTYDSTNLRLTYDNDTNQWRYTEQAYEYASPPPPTWSGYTSSDPDFEFAPDTPDTSPNPDDDPCPEGYIYDTQLKQCVPDPDYNPTGWMGEPTGGGGGGNDPDPNAYVDFKEMTYPDMINYGQDKGWFNDAGTYVGEQRPGWWQLGNHLQADRFAKEFALKGGKIWNPNAPLKGNLYIPKNDDLAKFIAGVDTWSGYATNINVHGDTKTTNVEDIGKSEITSVTGKTLEQIENEEAEKQEIIKKKKIAEKKQAEADLAAMDSLSQGQSYTDDKGDTYTKVTKDKTGGEGSQGYSFTPSQPKAVENKKYSHPAMGGKSVTVGPRAGVMAEKPRTGPDLRKR